MVISTQILLTIIEELQRDRCELLEFLTGDHDPIKTAFLRGQVRQIDNQINAYRKRIDEIK